MAVLFWVSVAVAAYVYAGYPLLLSLWARWRTRPVSLSTSATSSGHQLPGVSIVLAARNEGARLAARLDNLLALDYPADKRQIVVVCDGCSDDTEAVLARYAGDVEAVVLPASGKAAALNAGVARAQRELLVFADARQVFASDALRELAAPFADPSVGGVTGELLLDCESALFANRRADRDRRRRSQAVQAPLPRERSAPTMSHVVGASTGNVVNNANVAAENGERRQVADRRRGVISTIADGVGMYWRYEKELRRLESAIWSTLGATGAIYAIRRRLWTPLPADTLLDDVLTPMRVVLAGFRVVFNDKARAFDRAAMDADAESRRKVRTLAGNYQILALEPRLLLPWTNPVWMQYVSHKLGRLIVPFAWLTAFVANLVLAERSLPFQLLLAAQVAFFLLAGYGAVLEFTTRRASLPRAVMAPSPSGPVIATAQAATREVA